MKEIKIQCDKYKGKTLMEALAEEGVQLGGTCGGMGSCGKCKVIANGQEVLSCKVTVEEDVTVRVSGGREDFSIKETSVTLPEGFVWDCGEPGTYGIALDLGTTTVVVMLWNLETGALADVEAISNPQRFYGADVMSRIGFVLRAPWNLKRLQSCLVNEINQTVSKMMIKHGIKLGQIRKIAAVGNTAMSHFFLGEDVSGLAAYPFQPAFSGSVVSTAREMGLAAHEEAEVYVGPNIAGHVGSDITAGILAAGYMDENQRENRLFFDIGTNGEILLVTKDKAYCCSTAAGPAFEGSALHQGMRAIPGAIWKVDIESGGVQVQTIGDEPAKGICGSGIIDAMAAMVKHQVVDTYGRIDGPAEVNCFQLTKDPEVLVTQQDVREIQMAKAAIAAGGQMLMEEAGISLIDLNEVGIAGAFGNAIDLESGKTIGLLPKVEAARLRGLGNSAGVGASMLLLAKKCREKAEKFAVSVEHVELAASTAFQTRYIEEMNF